MAYLYRHIRLDKNEPFYVGIGGGVRGAIIQNRPYKGFIWIKNY